MQSYTEENCDHFSRKTVWLLLAIALNALELFLPRLPFLPWLKPGLANCITIVWIIKYGVQDAILFTLLRSWISGFYFGFSLLTISLSLSGGILATAAMGIAWNLLGKKKLLGTIGLSIIGAVFHNAAQLVVVYFLLTHNSSVFYQLPFMGAASLGFGAISGLIVPQIWNILNRMEIPKVNPGDIISRQSIGPADAIICSVILLFCTLLFSINDVIIMSVIGIAVTLIVAWIRHSITVLIYPLKFWPLFLFVFAMYLFFSYGTRLQVLTFLTYEGLHSASLQIIRVWIWLEAGLLLTQFRFHETFFSVLRIIFRKKRTTLIAGILALQYFPEVISFAKSKNSVSGLKFFKAPAKAISEYLRRIQLFISSKWEMSE